MREEHCLPVVLCLLFYTTQDHLPRSALPTMNWTLPHPLLIEITSHRYAWHSYHKTKV